MIKIATPAEAAINSMAYFVLQSLKNNNFEYGEELEQWINTFQDENSNEAKFLHDSLLEELIQGSYLYNMTPYEFLLLFKDYYPGQEDTAFFRIFVRVIHSDLLDEYKEVSTDES